jgi:hypothetical protein
MPVEMARRVLGQRIITIPIEGLLLLRWRPSGTVLVRQKHKETVTIPRYCQALGKRSYRNELRTRHANTCTRAGTVKFTSRILEGLMARRGLVEPREGIGLPFLYWGVVAAVEASVEEEE